MTSPIREPIEIITIDYDEWKIFKMGDSHYEYRSYPFSIAADIIQKIIIKYDIERDWYNFEAEEYCEVHGSGGWSKWINYSNETKDTLLNDAMDRIGK
jgi:hypothetical protein